MKSNIQKRWLIACVAGMAGSGLAQGNLTPPGAPAPTMKTLQQVEPRIDVMTLAGDASTEIIINSPGSYYLTDNLGVTKTFGIMINVSGVTLDLNGFVISGTGGGHLFGIDIKEGAGGVTVRNGTIIGYFSRGVNCRMPYGHGYLFEKLNISDCGTGMLVGESARILDCRVHDSDGGDGIWAAAGASISGCTVVNNPSHGIFTEGGSRISDCTALTNGLKGIKVLNNCVISGCAVQDNQDGGIQAGSNTSISDCTANNNDGTGIISGNNSSIRGCSVMNSQGSGITAGHSSSIIGCLAQANTGSAGIKVGNGCVVSECAAKENIGSFGIQAGTSCSIKNCSASLNKGTGNISYGIFASNGSTVLECAAYLNNTTNSAPFTSNQGIGIGVASSAIVKNCSSYVNYGDGIKLSGDCLVEGNTCDGNGTGSADGAGIHSTSTDNRIDGNTVTDNDRGIDVDSSGSLIVRNSASGNGANYSIAAGNDTGAIKTTPVGADAWDNFSF